MCCVFHTLWQEVRDAAWTQLRDGKMFLLLAAVLGCGVLNVCTSLDWVLFSLNGVQLDVHSVAHCRTIPEVWCQYPIYALACLSCFWMENMIQRLLTVFEFWHWHCALLPCFAEAHSTLNFVCVGQLLSSISLWAFQRLIIFASPCSRFTCHVIS